MAKKTISKSISEVLAKLLTIEGCGYSEPKYIDKRIEVTNLVIEEFSKDRDIEEINNAAFIICEIFSKYNVMNGSNEILSKLLDKPTIDKFFQYLKAENNMYTVNAAALVLSNIIAYYILQDANKLNNEDGEAQEVPENLKNTDETPLVLALAENIDYVVTYCKSTDIPEFENTFRQVVKPLGSTRLKLIELTSLAIKLNKSAVIEKIISSNLFGTILSLFCTYEWNNMLHNQVEKILNMVLLESQYLSLKKHLFEDQKLLSLIIKLTDSPDFAFREERKIRKGYIGHLVRLSNKINESTDEYVKSQIENSTDWKTYTEQFLADCNKLNSTNLGGKDPRAKQEEEEDDKNDVQLDLPNFMQKFSKYFNSIAKKNEQNDDDKDDQDEDKQNEDQDNSGSKYGYSQSNTKHTVQISFNKHTTEVQSGDQDEEIEEEDHQWFSENTNTTTDNSTSSEHHVQIIHKPGSEEEEEKEKPEEQDYNLTNYWKEPILYSADDILKEAGLI